MHALDIAVLTLFLREEPGHVSAREETPNQSSVTEIMKSNYYPNDFSANWAIPCQPESFIINQHSGLLCLAPSAHFGNHKNPVCCMSVLCNDSTVINSDNSPRKCFVFTQQPSTQEQKHLANICIFIIDGLV